MHGGCFKRIVFTSFPHKKQSHKFVIRLRLIFWKVFESTYYSFKSNQVFSNEINHRRRRPYFTFKIKEKSKQNLAMGNPDMKSSAASFHWLHAWFQFLSVLKMTRRGGGYQMGKINNSLLDIWHEESNAASKLSGLK